jgi:hypothetical protein
MVSRRRLLITGGISAITALTALSAPGVQRGGGQTDIPPGGTPSIFEDGVVQFDYTDGTKIRVYDNKIVISKPGQPTREKPYVPVDVVTLEMPVVPSDPTLKAWLEAYADDLRATVHALLRNDRGGINKYDEYESGLSLTVYKKMIVRYKYIKRLTRTE